MTQQQLLPSQYNNRSLFSDFYLGEMVKDDPHWQKIEAQAWELRQRVVNVLEEALPGLTEDTPEAEVEHRLIRPVLDILGHHYYVQKNVRTTEGQKFPDYGFFASEAERARAETQRGRAEFYGGAIAVGEAKRWDRPLDRRIRGPGDAFTNHNPSYQIDCYLRATDKRWGILTNGRLWRLYQRDLSYRLDVYYEVNLPELLKLDAHAFLYFASFFCRDAFVPDATGQLFLDRAYSQSLAYAASLGDELKDNVYEALRLLTEGFLTLPANRLTAAELDVVRENAFATIYRLLFIFYSESPRKGEFLLPMDNPTYRDIYSLRALSKEVADRLDANTALSPTATSYWSRLQELFRLINEGDEHLGVHAYNGGLFDDSMHPFLAGKRVGDSYLAHAIDFLARATAAGRTGRGFVTYGDLGVRELGSIYEGLLEQRPRIAEEPMVVIRDGKAERVVPEGEAKGKKAVDRYDEGQVYLTLHRGERKASGSYYTPEYIVKYIVQNTLGPLIEDMSRKGKDLLDTGEGIFSLKVLDPAMGSGHFLVEATDYLARALVEALGGKPQQMEEEEIRWARREVVERCIYGVDLNPLAVELAKLSLWLHTVSRHKPLNFLDHHLSCGNSLIGAWVKDLGILPAPKKKGKAQVAGTTLAGHRFSTAVAAAVNSFYQIMEAPSETIEDIHRKESAYKTAKYALQRIKDIADVWTSVYFDNEVKDKVGYESLLQLAESGQGEWPRVGGLPWLDRGRELAETKRFFHWEMEFPEVFFDRTGQGLPHPGFSAVIGNPPYAILGNYQEDEPFFSPTYSSARYKADYYMLFAERGLSLARENGFLSQIFPNKFCLTTSGRGLRQILSEHRIEQIVDFGTSQLFDGAINYVMISLIRRGLGTLNEYSFNYRRATAHFEQTIAEFPVSSRSLSIDGWRFSPATAEGLDAKIAQYSDELGTLSQSIFAGVQTGADKILVVSGSQLSRRNLEPETLRKFLRGRNIDRYEVSWEDDYLIYPYNAHATLLEERVLASRYPHTWDYLVEHKEELQTRIWFGKGPEERSGAWYGLMYLPESHLFNRIKILCPYLSHETSYCLDEAGTLFGVGAGYGVFLLDGCQVSLFYVLALLNSRLCSYRFKQVSPEFQAGHKNNEVYIKQLPIRRVDFGTPQVEREKLLADAKDIYEKRLVAADFAPLLDFIEARLTKMPDGTPDWEREQSDVVHDLLAFLAEEMTRLNKEKQGEVRRFLSWLESYLDVSVEELKNKTRVKEYWKPGADWDKFRDVLVQNKRTITKVKLPGYQAEQPVREGFDGSRDKLQPLLDRIQRTDWLIDQIVYRLYGLTEDEIAIVEGRA